MEYVVNSNTKIVVQVGMKPMKNTLQKENVSAYVRALRKLQGNGGKVWKC